MGEAKQELFLKRNLKKTRILYREKSIEKGFCFFNHPSLQANIKLKLKS